MRIVFKSFKKWKLLWKIAFLGTLSFLLFILITPLPNPLFNDPYSTTLRASNGNLLSASIAHDEQWRFPPSDSIPDKFAIAIKLYEDEYFRYHPGINPVSIVRAINQNFRSGKIVSGGSTLTMQTVRMAFHNPPRTYLQKFIELFAALKLELLYSKSSILRAYANHAPFGGNIVGISAASWRYYGRSPWQLSWAETSALAVLPNNPSAIFPGKNEENFLLKRNTLLDKLANRGYLTQDELFLAKQEPLPSEIKDIPNNAYHLLHRSITEGNGGTNIITTLDEQLQLQASQKVNRYSAGWAGNQVHNAAALIIDISTGHTMAYVGNSESSGNHGQHVDIITSQRSPGSLLKPILYASALDESLITPKQLMPDIPIFYKGFAPQNFDKQYRGAVPADHALISSLNVPFVHLLIDYGYEKFHQKLKQMGMASLAYPASHYGLSLILGGAETSLWELTSVYAGMVRAYENFPSRPYHSGYSTTDYFPNSYIRTQQTIEPPALEDHGYLQAPSIGFALRAMQQLNRPDQESGWEYFNSSKPIAWKTGTSYGFRDGWAIGISNHYIIGVWMGNADGEGRPGLTGVQAAAPLLFQLFDLIEDEAKFDEPLGMESPICAESGMRAGPNCEHTLKLALADYMENTPVCNYHQVLHLNKEETLQVSSQCYPVAQIKNATWFILPPVEAWYYQKHHPNYKRVPPFDPECTSSNYTQQFELVYPRQFTKVYIPIEQDGERGQAIFEAAHQDKDAILYWHLDNTYLGITSGRHQMGIRTTKGPHVITLVDDKGNELQQKFVVIN